MKKANIQCVWTGKKRTIFGLPLSFTRYFLTESKFITRSGFLNLIEDELDLYKITDKKLTLSLWERIFRCGTITINARDTDTPIKKVDSIKVPREFLSLLDKHINIQRDKYRIRGRDMIAFSDVDECEDCFE